MKMNDLAIGRARIGVLISGLVLLASSGLRAATYTWDGESSGDWGTAANWDATPVFAAGNEFVFYTGSGNLNTFLGASARTIGGLTFTANADSAIMIRTYVDDIGGVAGGNKILTLQGTTGDAFINVDADATGDIEIGAGGRVNFKSNLVITHNGSGNLLISQWMDDQATGSTITKNGTGMLTLGSTGAYLYSSGLTVNGGRVRLQSPGGLGRGTLTMTGGGLSSLGTTAITITNNVSILLTSA